MSASVLSFHHNIETAIKDYSALRAFELPILATLQPNLHAACFSVMKLFAARAIIEEAVAAGKITAGTRVVESTSGTFGLALAMLKSYYGYTLTLVSDPVIDHVLKTRLEHMGVTVEIIASPQDGSYQVARLARVHEILTNTPNSFFPNQYHNPANTKGYARLADYLAAQFPHIDCLIGTVGTGGSMGGTARKLREYFPQLKVIGVDTHNSVVFGQPNGPRQLRGLGNSLVPENVDHTQFDEVHWVSAAEAYSAARHLLKEYGLFMGGTSGAAFLVAQWYARKNPNHVTVMICPDEGYRYTDTVYNDAYVQTLPNWSETLPAQPLLIQHPGQPMHQWCWFPWGRRTRDEITSV